MGFEERYFPYFPVLLAHKAIKAGASFSIRDNQTTFIDRHKCRTAEELDFSKRFSKEKSTTKMCDITKYLVSLGFLPIFNSHYSNFIVYFLSYNYHEKCSHRSITMCSMSAEDRTRSGFVV